MICHNCQHSNPEGAIYCGQCGKPLAVMCPGCGHGNLPGSKFCSQCGHSIAAPPGARGPQGSQPQPRAESGERRQATVLFADLSGYTAMNERLDPEEVKSIIDRIRKDAEHIVRSYGGTVNRFIGDDVMALFGLPASHEDDPARAVRAALKLHESVRRQSTEFEARIGQPLRLHTGINSGLVVASAPDDFTDPYDITGDAVNIAARLRSLAGPDEILIGPETHRLVTHYFETQPLKTTRLKGKTSEILPYRVLRESPIGSRFESSEKRGLTPYVGRNDDLAVLHACLQKVIQGEGQLVTVEGDAGAGKSRLIYEFRHRIDRDRVAVSEGRCQAYGTDTPYLPFIDGLRWGLRLREADTSQEMADKVVASIHEIDPTLDKYLPFYLHLLSVPSKYTLPPHLKGKDLMRAVQEALAALVAPSAQERPMVFILEDWHWSDEASAAALKYLASVIARWPVMILVTHRSEHGLTWPHLSYHTNIYLRPLDLAGTEEIVRSVMHAAELPEGFVAFVHDRTGGNPLFIEEICHSLLESGAVSIQGDRVLLNQLLNKLMLPETVQAVIRSRLDRLDANAKEALQLAAVIGHSFPERLLERLYQAETSLRDLLETLKAQEVIQQTQVHPDVEYTFRHVLTRDVAYESLLLTRRKRLHNIIGEAIEESYADRIDEHAAILAYHYARSERQDKAAKYALRAGDRAAGLYANTEANTYFEQALEIARSMPESPDASCYEIDAAIKLAAVETSGKNSERDRTNLERARELAQKIRDERRLALVYYWLGRVHYVLADFKPVIQYAQESLKLADRLADEALASMPVNLMGRAYWQLSDFRKAAEMTERSIRQMRRVGNKTDESTAAGFVGALFGYLGEFQRALRYANLGIRLAEEIRNPFAEAANYHYRGIVEEQRGEWSHAIEDYERAREIASKAGDEMRVYIVKFMEGYAYTMSGEPDKGLKLLEESMALASKLGTKFLAAQARSCMAACRLARGETDAAVETARDALRLAERAQDRFNVALAHRILANALTQAPDSDLEEAKKAFTEAIRIQRDIGVKPELARSYLCYARLLRRAGESDESRDCVQEALTVFEELKMTWDRALAEQALIAF